MKVVIDKPLTGWKDLREDELKVQYDEVLKVGQHPDLPQRFLDKDIASYCKRNNCALVTPDIGAYTHFFETGTETVQIKRYGCNKEGDQIVYLVTLSEI